MPRCRVGKGALLSLSKGYAPCPLRRFGGHAELVIRPAEGGTRWLCPPYRCNGAAAETRCFGQPRSNGPIGNRSQRFFASVIQTV